MQTIFAGFLSEKLVLGAKNSLRCLRRCESGPCHAGRETARFVPSIRQSVHWPLRVHGQLAGSTLICAVTYQSADERNLLEKLPVRFMADDNVLRYITVVVVAICSPDASSP